MNPQDVPGSPDSPSRYGDTAHVMFSYCEEQRKHKAAANRGSDYSITISSTLAGGYAQTHLHFSSQVVRCKQSRAGLHHHRLQVSFFKFTNVI